jgi:hypothetical protein
MESVFKHGGIYGENKSNEMHARSHVMVSFPFGKAPFFAECTNVYNFLEELFMLELQE